MSSSGTNQLTQPTINGLSNLELTDLTTDNLNANNIDGDFFSIETIEANDVQVDNELELTNNGFITIGKGTGSEITITDTQVGFLDGVTSNIQTQINNSITDLTQIEADVTALEQEVDVLNNKTIYQSSNTTQQETIFSNKLILSSLANLDVGVEIQQNSADIATNTSNISTNTSAISNLSTQQTTNTFNIQQNALSIGTTSGGPTNSLFDRVKYITTNSNTTYNEGPFLQRNSNLTTTNITLNGGIASLEGDEPQIYLYKNGRTGLGQSGIIGFQNNTSETLIITNYQQDKNIDIFTRSGGSNDQINITASFVKANGVDINAKFNTNDSNITQINSDILGLSNTTSSLNIAVNNNTSAISANTASINNNSTDITTLQTQVSPLGSIMIYAGSTAPSGWLLCHGQSLSKFLYADLWNLIGDTYINGRPVRTSLFYNVDLRQLFVTGAGNNTSGYGINATTKSLGSFSSQSIMEHGHNYERPTNTFKASQSTFGTNVWVSNTQSVSSSGVILPGGGTLPGGNNSESRPYCMAMNYIIKT